jgi:ABC-type sugar transport system substrate-binding protein
MSAKISRREFLKAASKWSLFGACFMIGNNFLSSCVHLQDEKGHITEPKGQFFYSSKSLGYYFFLIQQEALQRAVESRGYEFTFEVSNMNAVKQTKQVTAAVQKKPTAIICDPVDSDQDYAKVIETLGKQGIPIGVIDTPLANSSASITIAFDNYKGGEIAAENVVKLLKQKHGEPSGIILNCIGDLSSVAWKLRKEGFENTIKKYKNIKLINKETKGDLTKMYDVTNEILVKYPNLDAIHAPSETPALGVYEALKRNNKLHPVGSTDHIIFVTIDGEPIAHNWIKEGFLDVSISQDPIAYGEICVEMLVDYVLKNKPIPKSNYSNDRYYWKNAEIKKTTHGSSLMIPPFIIDRNNVDDGRLWANIAYYKWGLKYL